MTPNDDGVRRGVTHVDLPLNATVKHRAPGDILQLARLGRELRLTDQILTFDLDTVSIVENGPAPAWTTLDGEHISFAASKMPFPTGRIDVAVWLGTNAHEVGHVLYSPRVDSPLMRRVINSDRAFLPGLAKLHNILEDQRQERLLLARFAPWRSYLTAALGHHLVADSESAHLLMAGRTWIPDSVRADARERFVNARSEHVADRVTTLIADYQRLTDPGETQATEAFAILEEVHGIFDDQTLNMPEPCNVIQAGSPDTDEPSDADLPPAADEVDDDENDDADGPSTPGEPAEKGAPDSQSDDDASADAASDDDQSSKAGRSADPNKPFTASDVRKDLKDAADDMLGKDDAARRDLDSVLDALKAGRTEGGVDGAEPLGEWRSATDNARRLHREVGDALLDLKDESEPGWVPRVDSGRLNTRRLLQSDHTPFDELFDRYEPGQMDAAELELVLLTDVSASMRSFKAALAEATWAIRQSCDDLDASATVITWDDGPHRVIAEPGQRPDDRMFVPDTPNGTNPLSALSEAFRLLADSRARNRIMLILTDGSWAGAETQSEQVIAAMSEVGITTVFAFLGHEHLFDGNAHGCAVAERIDAPRGLADLFRRVAAERIKAAF
jgi:hypothetical protein